MSSDNIIYPSAFRKSKGPTHVGEVAVAVLAEARANRPAAAVRSYVREWRERQGYTQSGLAMRIGIAQGALARCLALTVPLMLELSKALRCEVGDLFNPPPEESASA